MEISTECENVEKLIISRELILLFKKLNMFK